VAFVVGSIILFRDTGVGYQVSLPLVGSLAVVSAGFFLGVVGMAVKARRRPVVSGGEEMIGAVGEALEEIGDKGRIRVHGEVWSAQCPVPVTAGQKIRVTAREGLVLRVEPLLED
jgi:membrane-bound serine protease (ClpP class)